MKEFQKAVFSDYNLAKHCRRITAITHQNSVHNDALR